MIFLSLAFAQEPINPDPIIHFDQEWWIWVSELAPPEWPLYELPKAQSALYRLPEPVRGYPDRLLYWQTEELKEPTLWWTDLISATLIPVLDAANDTRYL